MNLLWQKILTDFGPFVARDIVTRPTGADDSGHLFSACCLSPESTEIEYLNLVNALVQATKPAVVIETGTAMGLGTLAIASALNSNNYGRLITVDLDFCNSAKSLVQKYNLNAQVEFVRSDARTFLKDYKGEKFNFAFIDSTRDMLGRRMEIQTLLDDNKLEGILAVHDMSTIRKDTKHDNPERQNIIDLLGNGGIGINYSRGLYFTTVLNKD